jgi:hypothetical protein
MIQSKEMGRGQNTRKNIQWRVEEWKSQQRWLLRWQWWCWAVYSPQVKVWMNTYFPPPTCLVAASPHVVLPPPTSVTVTSPHVFLPPICLAASSIHVFSCHWLPPVRSLFHCIFIFTVSYLVNMRALKLLMKWFVWHKQACWQGEMWNANRVSEKKVNYHYKHPFIHYRSVALKFWIRVMKAELRPGFLNATYDIMQKTKPINATSCLAWLIHTFLP